MWKDANFITTNGNWKTNIYPVCVKREHIFCTLDIKHICRSGHLCLGYLHHWTIIAIIANITKTPKNSLPADILKTQVNWHLRFICFAFLCLSSGCHFKHIYDTNWPGMFGTQFEWNCDKWIIFLSWGVVMYQYVAYCLLWYSD